MGAMGRERSHGQIHSCIHFNLFKKNIFLFKNLFNSYKVNKGGAKVSPGHFTRLSPGVVTRGSLRKARDTGKVLSLMNIVCETDG